MTGARPHTRRFLGGGEPVIDITRGKIQRAAIPVHRAATGLVGALATVLDTLLLWQERADQRRLLMSLDDRLLKDIGRGRGEAAGEYRKPFWLA